MPERDERLFWLHGRQVTGDLARQIETEHEQFAGRWQGSILQWVTCVHSEMPSDRLWLFRLKTRDPNIAALFNKTIQAYIMDLPSLVQAPNLKLKRQTNLPTPLVSSRVDGWPIADIGLHVVNDRYNGMLVTYSYHEGRYYHIPHLQLSGLMSLLARVKNSWELVACDCYKTVSDCCGAGCYECFQSHCSYCDGTGWKDFSRWTSGGFQIDYSMGVPIAKWGNQA